MKRIILLGYMGSGKTTLGNALSKDLGLPFYDLDWYIESRMRQTVKQLFDSVGEEGFRRIERNMLHEVAEFENVIVSCGGGTPCFYDKDRKSTRLNSSHANISYAVFCLKK